MKRDMDLCRKILIAVADDPSWRAENFTIEAEGFSKEEISFHIMLLQEARLLKAWDFTAGDGRPHWEPERLTWEGYEFLETARDTARWERAKIVLSKAMGGVGRFTLPILRELLTSYLREELRLP